MKNILAVSALVLGLGVTAVQAGYNGPSAAGVTVAEAKKLNDDAPVIMTGKITKSLGGEKYLFTDNTGSVTVEIDDDDWKGVDVNEKDEVEIRGEVEKDFTSFEIDVDSIVKK